jgi:hypothetical protein
MKSPLATSLLLLAGICAVPSVAADTVLVPGALAKLGTVDPRFQSYNLEMIEVTGGAFWKPYGAADTAPQGPTPAGMDPKIYAYRAPKDLTNPKLRKLAAALGPAYIRVSGTWANTSYFADTDTPPKEPPTGFAGVLTRAQWKGVIAFSKAVDAKIITSFPVSMGTRDTAGIWTPETSKAWLAYTKAIDGEIAAAEYMNEPNLVRLGGLGKDYDAAAYARDFKIWRTFLNQAEPKILVLGPGSVGVPSTDVAPAASGVVSSGALVNATGAGVVDVFSYHHYGDVSQRCKGHRTEDNALAEEWFSRTAESAAYYRGLRDRFEPGKPLWLTEVGDAACGGNPWAKTFLDSFRYLDQLGRLARDGVSVVAHNTLAISDYGLLDEKDYTPRPNYWAALVWRRLMGTTVLDSGVPIREGQHVYAQCTRDKPGAVTLLIINNSREVTTALSITGAGQRYTLSADKPDSKDVKLNGNVLALGPHDALPALTPVATKSGVQHFAPATITFLVVSGANNAACR